jgi:hypothetical protein
VYLWNASQGRYTQRGIDIGGEAFGDRSGASVSLSKDGNVLAIGAHYGRDDNSGYVLVYSWSVDQGKYTQRGMAINGEASWDYSGNVALSGDGSVLAIGAGANDGEGNGFPDSGHVRVYSWDETGDNYIPRGIDIDGEATGDRSGSLALSRDGNILAVGALFNDGTNAPDSGHVRVYSWNVGLGRYTQRGFDIDGEASGDHSGRAVSMSDDGSVLAIGAARNGGDDDGHVRVYSWNIGLAKYTQRGWDIDGEGGRVNSYGEGDLFGYSVSLSGDGNVLAVGAIWNDGNGDDSGHVCVFSWNVGL